MTWPLIALAVPAVFVGWTWMLGLPFDEPVLEYLLTYGEPVRGQDLWSMHYLAMAASLLIALSGIGAGIAFYAPSSVVAFGRRIEFIPGKRLAASAWAERFPRVYDFLVHKWYFDELYQATLVGPCLAVARGLSRFDKLVVDGLVNGSALLTWLLSRLEGVFDRIAVDGLVNLSAAGVYILGDWGRKLQTGLLRNYLMVLAGGLVCLAAGVFVWVQGG